ncbi:MULTISPECIES: GTP cyclohydrolase II [Epilithonimonas]|uniref:GTP cyclohydrolase-2 n=1 Tax=Epilithonimonas hominis TaxID=420404 RepID=A0A3N0X957_9FLAO|nr:MULTISPECIES: GTP cyclohydrolase II [Epilithonimonas]ROI13321.1 GTP cyclohydrolase II [Epilithonimonas hominis]HAP94467.1 GTP cyclohydrolase II [Chryseobacterium sp.]
MLKLQAESNVPTQFGEFKMMAFSEDDKNWMPHMALIAKDTDLEKPTNVRIHSECITGEVFHSKKCECGEQLDAAMKFMQENGGIILYLRQEGRNIGIINKLKAYALQEKGLDTVQANLQLGLPADDRDFSVAIDMLEQIGVKSVNLMTNNPEKIRFIKNSNIAYNSRIPLQIKSNDASASYLKTKKDYFGHLLDDENQS